MPASRTHRGVITEDEFLDSTEPLEEEEERDEALDLLPPELKKALEKRGYKTLTAVQRAVLDPELADHDLRVSSQTGSGKTIAIAILLAKLAKDDCTSERGIGRPRALVLTPTRELAAQVKTELSWALAPFGAKIAVVAGGASYVTENRSLAQSPMVVVGTPGRLIDHLDRGSIATDNVATIVLDEADQMLDLGFREAIEKILSMLSEERRTHLVSATFSREVSDLANRYQKDARQVEGTKLGAANSDIDHIIHLIPHSQRNGALINILLAKPDEQTLIFARTRAEVAEITDGLISTGFVAASLSGEMSQEARNRTLAAYKAGTLRILVATDVAARGIDVQEITLVVHLNPPGNAENYVHRSGRTGRAGRKGASVLLITASMYSKAMQMMRRAGVKAHVEPVPTAREIFRAADDRLFAEIVSELKPTDEGTTVADTDPRLEALAMRLLEQADAKTLLALLLKRTQHVGRTEPRVVYSVKPPDERPERMERGPRRDFDTPRFASERPPARQFVGGAREERAPREERFSDRPSAPPRRDFDAPREGRAPRAFEPREDRAPRSFESREDRAPRSSERPQNAAWVPFVINWGERHGADPRRLLALACRRGQIRGTDVGSIRIGPSESSFEVAAHVADSFTMNAARRDARDPGLRIEPTGRSSQRPPPPYSARAVSDGGDGPPPRSPKAPFAKRPGPAKKRDDGGPPPKKRTPRA
jgi:ATP-dependent RNA helicase DeaD